MVVVVLPEELELLDESSFFAQEIVRLINVDRIRNKIFFIFSPIPKDYYWFVKDSFIS